MRRRRYLYYQQQSKIFPMTYFEVKNVRPGKEQVASPDGIFVLTPGGISILGKLSQNVLQFLTGKDLMRFTLVSKSTEIERQVNEHRFKKKDRVCINGINGYVVRVTKKIYYVREVNVFRMQPDIERMKNAFLGARASIRWGGR